MFTSKHFRLFYKNEKGDTTVKECNNINPYLISGPNIIVQQQSKPPLSFNEMRFGNMPADGGNLLLSFDAIISLCKYLRELHFKLALLIFPCNVSTTFFDLKKSMSS